MESVNPVKQQERDPTAQTSTINEFFQYFRETKVLSFVTLFRKEQFGLVYQLNSNFLVVLPTNFSILQTKKFLKPQCFLTFFVDIFFLHLRVRHKRPYEDGAS